MVTKEITNFQGRLTRYSDGDFNSGLAKYATTYGNDPFTSPGNLTWFEAPTQIDPTNAIITDLIMAAKPKLESGITYVYAIGHTGRLYKIQVNDPTTYNPNYDNPTLLTTLVIDTPTFRFGASMTFFGSTEQIVIGHDKGATRINFDGTGETAIGVSATWAQSVPRPVVNFNGKLEFGNGTNLAETDTSWVVNYTKLTPAFPIGTTVRDIDVSPDGNIVQITVSRVPSPDMTVTTQDTSSLSSGDSYIFKWNGIDLGYTSFDTYNSYSINSNISFGNHSYTMGYDLGGAAIYQGGDKIITLNNSISPNFNAMFSTGNLLGFAAPENSSSALTGSLITYGQYDREIPAGLFRFFRKSATAPQTDIVQMPLCLIVSNLFYGSSSAGYSGNQVGSAKVYFSTLETSGSPTTKYRFYKFTTVPTGLGTVIGGVYETQSQLFSKKIKPGEIRFYMNPVVANNSFQVDLIGSGDNIIANSTKTFTTGSTMTAGQDYCWYRPEIAPTYALGIRITNLGSVNMTFSKIEVDINEGGK